MLSTRLLPVATLILGIAAPAFAQQQALREAGDAFIVPGFDRSVDDIEDADLFNAAGETIGEVEDVLVDGNDCKVTSLDLRVIDEGAADAVGRAEFENFGAARTIDLVMAKTGGDWKVTDIVYRHRPFSLKAIP